MADVPIEIAIPRLARMGYTGLELTILPGYTTALERLDDAARQRIPALLREHGMQLTALAAHSRLLDPPEYMTSITRLREAVHLAVALDPDDPPPINTLPGGVPDDWDAVRHRVVDEYARLGEYAAPHGVSLAIEPHVGAALSRPDQAVWLIEQIARPNVGLNLDYSHFQAIGMSVEEAVPPLAPHALHTHIKGVSGRWPEHAFLTPGEDDFDHATYLGTMHECGYRGYETVEISKMVVARPDYEPFAHAQLAYDTLADAARRAGIG